MNNIRTAIANSRKKLIHNAFKTGIYENFGQKEVRRLSDKYINLSDYSPEMNHIRELLKQFSDWCSRYSPEGTMLWRRN
jgi:hypothetical protein